MYNKYEMKGKSEILNLQFNSTPGCYKQELHQPRKSIFSMLYLNLYIHLEYAQFNAHQQYYYTTWFCKHHGLFTIWFKIGNREKDR